MSTIGVKAIKYPDGDSAINITDGGNVTLAGTLGVTGAITGTLATAAQTNITSVGTLTSFRSTGIDDNADATAITINSSENVGIGITTPEAKLDIRGITGASSNAFLVGYGSNGDNYYTSGASGQHIFRSANTERMRIDSSGRVGIFESSPAAGLHITSTNNDLSKIRLGYSTSNHFLEIGRQAGYYRLASFEDGQSLTFGTSRSAGATTERMRIDADGKVGIEIGRAHVRTPVTS